MKKNFLPDPDVSSDSDYADISLDTANSSTSYKKPEFVEQWQASLLGVNDETDSFKSLFPNAGSRGFPDAFKKILGNKQPTLGLILDKRDESAAEEKKRKKLEELNSIQRFVAQCLASKQGSFSLRMYVYYIVGAVLPSIAAMPIFPSEEDENFTPVQKILFQYNILFTNILFVASTILTRIFVARAGRIGESVDRLNKTYEDLDLYLKECCHINVVDYENVEKYIVREDLQKINYIIANAWYAFGISAKVRDWEAINKYRIAEASANMKRALIAYLISARKSKYKGELFSDEFILKISSEFSSILFTSYEEQNWLQKITSFHMAWHLSFFKMPSFLDFSRGISKIATLVNHWKTFAANQEEKNDQFILNFAGMNQMYMKFSTFRSFYEVDGNSEATRLLKSVGESIAKRVGKKTAWYYTISLGVVSSLLGGLPLLTSLYQRQDLFGVAFYFVAPIAFVLFLVCEKMNVKIQNSEQKYKDLYEEYEKRLRELVDNNKVNVTEFEADTLKQDKIEDNESFKSSQKIIANTLLKINLNQYSEKERVLITVTLFNSFSDFLLAGNALPDTDKTGILSARLADYIQSHTSYNLIGSLYRASPARSHLKGNLKPDTIQSIIKEVGRCSIQELSSCQARTSSYADYVMIRNAAYEGAVSYV